MNCLVNSIRLLLDFIDADTINEIIASSEPIGFGYFDELVCMFLHKNRGKISVRIERYIRKRRFLSIYTFSEPCCFRESL